LNVFRQFYLAKYQILSTNIILSSHESFFLIWDLDSNLIRTNLTKNGNRFGFGWTQILRIRATTSVCMADISQEVKQKGTGKEEEDLEAISMILIGLCQRRLNGWCCESIGKEGRNRRENIETGSTFFQLFSSVRL
jgi:hypothetical protein